MGKQRKLSVSELTDLIRLSLEEEFSGLIVEGEISNFRPSSTGHLYFTLKDAGAVISAVMFKNRLRELDFNPGDGMLVRVKGNISVYPQRGNYQIICEEMELAGTGDILVMLEKRKQALAFEGLFDSERKKPIPRFPKTVAVISSPTGAAVRDILTILKRRAAGISVVILPSPVQGSDAAPILKRRIEQANEWKLADVIIIGRGGGSLEDLLPFSDEEVVRAVAASLIPVISAVGHEIDWSLADLAADLRAPTPSAAAELVSESRREALDRVMELGESIRGIIAARLERAKLSIRPFKTQDLEYRFRAILQPRLVRFDDAKEALLRSLEGRLAALRHRLELGVMALEAGSPQAILDRGFSLVINKKTGKIIKTFKDTVAGDTLIIRPREGCIMAETKQTQKDEYNRINPEEDSI